MGNYIKIIGNKDRIISDFIEKQKKYWFHTKDLFTGIRTIHYKNSTDLKEQIEDLVFYLKDNKLDFAQDSNGIKLLSERLEIYNVE